MMETIVNWLIEDQCFTWFNGSGLAFIFCCIALGWCVACCVSKRVRAKFF